MLKTVGNPSVRYGDQTIVDGNLIFGTAGKGVSYPVTGGGSALAPAFSAHASAAQTIPDGGVGAKITLDVENFDTNSNFASSRFTPTVAGYYQISAAVFFNSATGGNIMTASIYKNGAAEKTVFAPFLAIGYGAAAVSTLVYLNGTTDYIELYTFQNSGSSQTTQGGNASTWMTGVLIRP